MQVTLTKKEAVGIDVWVNERKITDSTWQVYVDDGQGDTIYLVLKEPNGQNQVKININKYTTSEDVK